MNALVVYDSVYGNTAQIAAAIARGFGDGARVLPVAAVDENELNGVELLVAGSPIQNLHPSAGMREFLSGLRSGSLQGVRAATYDTRVRSFFHGDAAGKINRALRRAGAQMVSPPQGFYVGGREGPPAAGEVERAMAWGQSLIGGRAKD